jgi:hypothetical protein
LASDVDCRKLTGRQLVESCQRQMPGCFPDALARASEEHFNEAVKGGVGAAQKAAQYASEPACNRLYDKQQALVFPAEYEGSLT